MNYRLFITLAILVLSACATRINSPPLNISGYTHEATIDDWDIYSSNSETACAARSVHKDTELIVVALPDAYSLSISKQGWVIPEGENYEIFVQVDSATPHKFIASSGMDNFVSFSFAQSSRILDDARDGESLYVHARADTIEILLNNFDIFLEEMKKCQKKVETRVENPFADSKITNNKDLFGERKVEPILDRATLDQFLQSVFDIADVNVNVQFKESEYGFGDYSYTSSDAVIVYWEEMSGDRSINELLTDAVSEIQQNCDTFGSRVFDEREGDYTLRISAELAYGINEDALSGNISVVELSNRVFIWTVLGSTEDSNAVNLAAEIINESFVVVLEEFLRK